MLLRGEHTNIRTFSAQNMDRSALSLCVFVTFVSGWINHRSFFAFGYFLDVYDVWGVL